MFLIVEKLVRYVEDFSGGDNAWGLGHHHHHHHKHTNKLKDDDEKDDHQQGSTNDEIKGNLSENISEENESDRSADLNKSSGKDVLRKVG